MIGSAIELTSQTKGRVYWSFKPYEGQLGVLIDSWKKFKCSTVDVWTCHQN